MSGFNTPTGGDYNINGVSPTQDISTVPIPKLTLVSPTTNLSVSGIVFSGTAGENLVFGDNVYLKTDGKYWKAKADAYATTPVSAMAVATISTDASGVFLQTGLARDDSWAWSIGVRLLLSAATGGALTHTEPSADGNQVQHIGYPISATVINFNPSPITFEISTV